MGAEVLDRCYLVFLAAIENDFFAADLPSERALCNFIGSTGDVPRVFWVHENPPSQRLLLFLMDPLGGECLLQVNLG
ncbi:hypothetical protein D3C79_1054320 [compost metagenome]